MAAPRMAAVRGRQWPIARGAGSRDCAVCHPAKWPDGVRKGNRRPDLTGPIIRGELRFYSSALLEKGVEPG